MIAGAEPGLYDRDPAAAAGVSIDGWLRAAWIACALWPALALADRDAREHWPTVVASGAIAAGAMTAGLWLIGHAVEAAMVRLHPARSARTLAALRIFVTAMYVASFMAATGLFLLLAE